MIEEAGMGEGDDTFFDTATDISKVHVFPNPLNIKKDFNRKAKPKPPFLSNTSREASVPKIISSAQVKILKGFNKKISQRQKITQTPSLFSSKKKVLKKISTANSSKMKSPSPDKKSLPSINLSDAHGQVSAKIPSQNKLSVICEKKDLKKQIYDITGFGYKNYIGSKKGAPTLKKDKTLFNPFIKIEFSALKGSLRLLSNEEKMKFLRKSEEYKDNVDLSLPPDVLKAQKANQKIIGHIMTQRQNVKRFEAQFIKRSMNEAFEEIRSSIPQADCKKLLSPKWERKAFKNDLVKYPESSNNEVILDQSNASVIKHFSSQDAEEKGGIPLTHRGKVYNKNTVDPLSTYIRMFIDLEKKTNNLEIQKKGPLGIKGHRPPIQPREEQSDRTNVFTKRGHFEKEYLFKKKINYWATLEARALKQRVISLQVLKENFPDLFLNRGPIGDRILYSFGIVEAFSEQVDWPRFYEFVSVCIYYDCSVEEMVAFAVKFFRGPDIGCSVEQFLKLLKVLILERTRGDLQKTDDLMKYFNELYRSKGIIDSSENVNFEKFVEEYVELRLEIIHIVDLITNKQ